MTDNLIQRPDLIFRLQQFMGLRHGDVVPRLSDTVSPVVLMGDVREVADEKVVARPCSGTISGFTDIVGFHVACILTNPTGSGVVVRVHEIEFNLAPCLVTLQANVSGGVNGAFRDFDVPGPIPRALIGQFLQATYPAAPHAVLYPLLPGRNWQTGWTLYPGHRLLLDSREDSGAGTLQDFTFWWTESTLRSS